MTCFLLNIQALRITHSALNKYISKCWQVGSCSCFFICLLQKANRYELIWISYFFPSRLTRMRLPDFWFIFFNFYSFYNVLTSVKQKRKSETRRLLRRAWAVEKGILNQGVMFKRRIQHWNANELIPPKKKFFWNYSSIWAFRNKGSSLVGMIKKKMGFLLIEAKRVLFSALSFFFFLLLLDFSTTSCHKTIFCESSHKRCLFKILLNLKIKSKYFSMQRPVYAKTTNEAHETRWSIKRCSSSSTSSIYAATE